MNSNKKQNTGIMKFRHIWSPHNQDDTEPWKDYLIFIFAVNLKYFTYSFN